MPTAKTADHVPTERAQQSGSATASPGHLLAGQAAELERLQVQSRVWERSGRRLLAEIGDGRGTRALRVEPPKATVASRTS